MLSRPIATLLLAGGLPLALLGCPAPTAPSDVALGAEFALAPGESAVAGDDGFLVTFESVTEESRCPMDALCIVPGRVVLDVSAGRGLRRVALSPGDVATVESHRLRLVQVEPYPSAAQPIPSSAYRATFVVERP